MFENDYHKNCPSCGEDYYAKRTNQVYCTPECKAKYHNGFARRKRHTAEQRRTITQRLDEILWNNRCILKEYSGTEQNLEDLKKRGFQTNHITSFAEKEKKKTLFIIYDTAYHFLDTETIFVE